MADKKQKKNQIQLTVLFLVLGLIIGFALGISIALDYDEIDTDLPVQDEPVNERVYFYCDADSLYIVEEGEVLDIENAKP